MEQQCGDSTNTCVCVSIRALVFANSHEEKSNAVTGAGEIFILKSKFSDLT